MAHRLLTHAVDVAHRLYLAVEAAYKTNEDVKLVRDLENVLLVASSVHYLMLCARSLENSVDAVHQLHHAARAARDLENLLRDVRTRTEVDDVVRRLDDAVEWWRHFANATDVGSDLSFELDVARYVLRKTNHDVSVPLELAIASILEHPRDSRCAYCGRCLHAFADVAEGCGGTSCTM